MNKPKFEFKPAVRRDTPCFAAIVGPGGSGKTWSALLLAAGLAGPNGKVGIIDTEAGRGSWYVDSPAIRNAMPRKEEYLHLPFDSPFSPSRFGDAIEAAADQGITALVIDSFSHEHEGPGGLESIADAHKSKDGQPNWVRAKLEHKSLMYRLIAKRMKIVFCLRAREKVRVERDDRNKLVFVNQGMLPICEKNLPYEMTLMAMLEEGTHLAYPTKLPDPLKGLFANGPALITKDMGVRLREWMDGAEKVEADPETLIDRATAHSRQGLASYQEFYLTLPNDQRAILKPYHERNKEIAASVDEERANGPQDDETATKAQQQLLAT